MCLPETVLRSPEAACHALNKRQRPKEVGTPSLKQALKLVRVALEVQRLEDGVEVEHPQSCKQKRPTQSLVKVFEKLLMLFAYPWVSSAGKTFLCSFFLIPPFGKVIQGSDNCTY